MLLCCLLLYVLLYVLLCFLLCFLLVTCFDKACARCCIMLAWMRACLCDRLAAGVHNRCAS